MSKITVTTIAGATSGADANKVKIESGDTLEVVSNATVGGDLTVDTSTLKVDSSNNNVGIGETSPLGKLHIKSGDSAASSVNGNANELVVENSDYTGITVLGENETSIMFGDNEDPDVGRIVYFHGTNTMSFMTNANNAMHIDSAGRITTPNMPYFRVQKTNGNLSSPTIIVWNTVIQNVGSHYNSSNGRFTAPVAGVYQFNVLGSVTSGGTTTSIHRVRINGTFQSDLFPIAAAINHESYTLSFALKLSANDYIDIESGSSTWYGTGNYHNGYTGYLVG